MIGQALCMEQMKVVRRKLLWGELAMLSLMFIGLGLMLYGVLRQGGEGSDSLKLILLWPNGLLMGMSTASGIVGQLLITVLVAGLTAQEYAWRTTHLWLSHGMPRSTLLAAKFAVSAVLTALLIVVALIAGGLCSAVITRLMHGSIGLDQVKWADVVRTVAVHTYILLPYAALAFLLAIATRSTLVTIGVGVAYAVVLEGLVMELVSFASGAVANVAKYLPGKMAEGLLQAINTEIPTGGLAVNGQRIETPTLDPATAAIGIAFYIVVFLVVTVWIFRRQDLTS